MSRDFNGTTSLIALANSATLRPVLPLTLSAWCRPDSLKVAGIVNNNKTGADHRGAWIISADTSGHIEASFGDGAGSASSDRETKLTSGAAALTVSVWNHVCATFRAGGDITIYINGADAGGAYSGTGNTLGYAANGGRIGVSNVSFFDGLIAECALWSISLSAADAVALSKGVPARMVRPEALLSHLPIWGVADPEIDLSANSLEPATLTSVTVANHAPVGCPFPLTD